MSIIPINPSQAKFLNSITSQNPGGNNIKERELVPFQTKMKDVIFPNSALGDFKLPEIGDIINLNNYSQTYTTGEDKARVAKFADPLTLNYKLILDFDRKSGLIADESNVDSALAFLNRIGDIERYEMLKHWIELFKTIVKDYDFLFMDVEGLQEVQFNHPTKFYFDNFKLKFVIRETLDLMIQSLITTYKDICYDNIRGVTVLPSNLQKFDCYVVVYSAGYYNMLFHDFDKDSDDELDLKVLPTKRKLSDEVLSLDTIDSFNHMLYQFVSCKFDFESGQDFLNTVSNDMSAEITKNNITLTYKFANSSGTFNNITGNNNFFNLLAQASAANKLNNEMKLTYEQKISEYSSTGNETKLPISGNPFNPNSESKFWNSKTTRGILSNTNIDEQVAKAWSQAKSKDTYKNIYKNLKDTTLAKLNDKVMNQIPTKLMGPHSVIGKLFGNVNADGLTNILQNTIDKGLNIVENYVVTDPLTKINNLLFNNYSDDLISTYQNIFPKITNPIEILEQTPTVPYPQTPEGEYNSTNNYVRPINPTLENSKQKFINDNKGLTFFGDSDEIFDRKANNIYVRKTF